MQIQEFFDALVRRLPPAPARVLFLDHGGKLEPRLRESGYQVIAFDPAQPAAHPADALILLDCAELPGVFSSLAGLLPENGAVLCCNTVIGASPSAAQIEAAASEAGFYVAFNQRAGQREAWEFRPSRFIVRGYRAGEESVILDTFRQVFNAQRSPEHWRWKFRDDPFGRLRISTVWDGDTLTAHYAGYCLALHWKPLPSTHWKPLPEPVEGSERGEGNAMIYQVGDTLTRPEYRGVGKGNTSLLRRAFNHFERQYCEGQIPFGYGFNTGKIQRFGKLFLGYDPVQPVYEWFLQGAALVRWQQENAWRWRLAGWSAERCPQAGAWADEIFAQAAPDYGWLTRRDRQYLQWRYDQHPDFRHEYWLLRRWGRPVGWWLVKKSQDGVVLIGDALFCKNAAHAAGFALRSGLLGLQELKIPAQQLRGWFSSVPAWWNQALQSLGFERQRQFQTLDLCVKSYAPGLSSQQIGENYYFTHGDSDLF